MQKLVMIGGHHSCALPVISKLREISPDIKIYWFGHKYTLKGSTNPTLEYLEITELNIPFYDLKAGKFYKTYSPSRLIKIPFGFFQALFLLIKIRPEVIMSFGGYLAVPVVLAGKLLRIPVITHEQTVVSGYANKVISKFADRILYSWETSLKFFPAKKSRLVGLPLRKQVFNVSSNNYALNSNLPTIYITAGKTGSHKINMVIKDVLYDLLELANVIHQTGNDSQTQDCLHLTKYYDSFRDKPSGVYFCREFIKLDEIGEVFSKADLVISRSGANATYELLILNKPCLLIPIPWVSHDEQNENAKVLKTSGLAEILPEENLEGDKLLSLVKIMLSTLRNYHASNIVTPVDSAQLIVDEILSFAKKKTVK